MSKQHRYYAKGAEKTFKNFVPSLRERIEFTESKEQTKEIRSAIQTNSASRYLKDRDQ